MEHRDDSSESNVWKTRSCYIKDEESSFADQKKLLPVTID